MDPDETLRLISEALEKGYRNTATEHARDLIVWLDKGGFAPNWKDYPKASQFVQKDCGGAIDYQ